VTKTARDKVEIIAGNSDRVDESLELVQSFLKEEEEGEGEGEGSQHTTRQLIEIQAEDI
jgi:hypothetical protein